MFFSKQEVADMANHILLDALGEHAQQTVKQLNEWMTCDDSLNIRMLRDSFKDSLYWIEEIKKEKAAVDAAAKQ